MCDSCSSREQKIVQHGTELCPDPCDVHSLPSYVDLDPDEERIFGEQALQSKQAKAKKKAPTYVCRVPYCTDLTQKTSKTKKYKAIHTANLHMATYHRDMGQEALNKYFYQPEEDILESKAQEQAQSEPHMTGGSERDPMQPQAQMEGQDKPSDDIENPAPEEGAPQNRVPRSTSFSSTSSSASLPKPPSKPAPDEAAGHPPKQRNKRGKKGAIVVPTTRGGGPTQAVAQSKANAPQLAQAGEEKGGGEPPVARGQTKKIAPRKRGKKRKALSETDEDEDVDSSSSEESEAQDDDDESEEAEDEDDDDDEEEYEETEQEIQQTEKKKTARVQKRAVLNDYNQRRMAELAHGAQRVRSARIDSHQRQMRTRKRTAVDGIAAAEACTICNSTYVPELESDCTWCPVCLDN
jgi:hypothetical protein